MMEKIDYKKVYKDLYLPKKKPMLIDVPEITFITVKGKGNPNISKEYQEAMELLYGISYTIKMSKMTENKIEGYFEYVVPPLEGFWWLPEEPKQIGVFNKDDFIWKSMIRLPEFVTKEVFDQAKETLKAKKPHLNLDKANYEVIKEGKCVQIMHIGSYDDEPATIEKLYEFVAANGLEMDLCETRQHHEIYLSDPRKCKIENLKTVIRYPVKERV